MEKINNDNNGQNDKKDLKNENVIIISNNKNMLIRIVSKLLHVNLFVPRSKKVETIFLKNAGSRHEINVRFNEKKFA